MYSVVMMMVLSSSPESVAFGHRNGCNGCYGGCAGYACSGCNGGGCWGGASCCGGRGGLFHRNRGCNGCYGGCTGNSCNGCYGGGCWGGHRHSRHSGCCGNNACGCTGSTGGCWGSTGGCWGGSGCWGGQPMAAPMTAPQGQPAHPETAPAPKPGGSAMAPAVGTIVVSLPADAKVNFDGVATSSTSDVRRFSTPELAVGTVASYTLTAEVVRDGQKLSTTRLVTVKAGETLEVSLPLESFTTSLVRN